MSGITTVHGILLAAGAGRRSGGPKALRRDSSNLPWVVATARAMTVAGCSPVVVTTGCEHEQVRDQLAGEKAVITYVSDWETGIAASLRAGLREVMRSGAPAALIHLVDLPRVGPAAIRRVLTTGPITPDSLRRACYDGTPGHPVLIGSAHYHEVIAATTGDTGAGRYLSGAGVTLIPCEDVADGADADYRADATRGRHAWDPR